MEKKASNLNLGGRPVMGAVHEALAERGKQGCLDFDAPRRVIEAAASFLADENDAASFFYSGFAHIGLPHRRLPDEAAWQVTTERASMVVTPGHKPSASGKPVSVGVPYGAKARLILLHLQTQAIRNQSREIELGNSLRDWLRRMGIPQGGKSIQDVKEQAERIARCSISFDFHNGDVTGMFNQTLVDGHIIKSDPSNSLEHVYLSERFFEQLRRHPVPIAEAAIKQLNGNSVALDIYCWLSYRLHVLKHPVQITWNALKAQFGAGTNRLDHFRSAFRNSLQMALAVYPDAKVDCNKNGIVIHPCRSPISAKIIKISSVKK